MAGTRTWRGTTNANWGTAGNWLENAVPDATNDCVFDASSPNCTVNTTNRVCTTINFTNYPNTSTITMTYAISVYGNITLGANMKMTGAGALQQIASGNLTSNGKTWATPLTFGGTSQTYVLMDDWTVSGTVTFGGSTAIILNSNTGTKTLNCGGHLLVSQSVVISGTAALVMYGTGTWYHSSTGQLRNNLTFNASGKTITIGTATYPTVRYNTGVLTHTAGTTVDASTNSSTLVCAVATTLNTSGMTWYNVTFSGGAITYTLSSDLNMSGTFTCGVTTGATVISGAFNINVGGSVTCNVTSGNVSGSAIVMNGTGTLSTPNATTGSLRNNITFNTAGDITLSGTINYSNGTMTYTTAANMYVASSTLNLAGACTLDIGNTSINNMTVSSAVTITLLSNVHLLGSFSSSSNCVLNGNSLYIGTDLIVGASNSIKGTTLFVMNGTGTLSGTGGYFNVSIEINTAGAVAIGSVTFFTAVPNIVTLKCTTPLTTSVVANSTLTIKGDASVGTGYLDLNGIVLENLLIYNTAGSGTWFTLKSGFSIAKSFVYTGLTSSYYIDGALLDSFSPGVQMALTLLPGATQDLGYVNATDIDSSAGVKIWSFRGVLSNATNWRVLTAPPTICSIF